MGRRKDSSRLAPIITGVLRFTREPRKIRHIVPSALPLTIRLVRIEAVADPVSPIFTEEDFAIDFDQEFKRLVEQTRDFTAQQAMNQSIGVWFFTLASHITTDGSKTQRAREITTNLRHSQNSIKSLESGTDIGHIDGGKSFFDPRHLCRSNHWRHDALRVNPEGPTLCRQSRSEDETALGHNRPDQNASALTTSPPARVPSAFQIDEVDAALDEPDRAVHEQDVHTAGVERAGGDERVDDAVSGRGVTGWLVRRHDVVVGTSPARVLEGPVLALEVP